MYYGLFINDTFFELAQICVWYATSRLLSTTGTLHHVMPLYNDQQTIVNYFEYSKLLYSSMRIAVNAGKGKNLALYYLTFKHN